MKAQVKIEKNSSVSIRHFTFALLILLGTIASMPGYGQGYGQGNRTTARPSSDSGNNYDRGRNNGYNNNRNAYPDDDYDDPYYDNRNQNNRNNDRNQDYRNQDYRNGNQNNRNNGDYRNGNNNPNNRNNDYRDNDPNDRNGDRDPNYRNNSQNNARRPDARTAAAAKKDSIDKAKKDSVKKAFCRHEFSFWGGGGLSTLRYRPAIGDKTNLFGGNFGLGYTLFFNENWGLMLGAEVAFYNAKIKIPNFRDRYTTEDADREPIIYNANVRRYTEKQHLANLNIPLLLQYQTSIFGNEHKFYVNLGFKLGIPVSKTGMSSLCNFSSEVDLQASGTYYTSHMQTLYDQRDLGYGDFSGKKSGKLDFDLSYMAEADAGVKWSLGRRFSLYTGLYFDYAFNDIVKTHEGSFIEYNHLYPEDIVCRSVLTSQYVQNPDNPSNTRTSILKSKVSPLAVGLKLKLGINMCKLSPKEKAEKEKKKEDGKLEESLNKKKKPKVVLDAEDDDRQRLDNEYGPVKDVSVLYVESYEINVSKLSPVMKMMLDKRIESLKKYNSDRYQIICEGHACDIGTKEANLNIGQARADTVRKYLISKGFKAKNVVAITKGDANPVVPNDSEVNRKINRRVVFVVVEK